MRGSATVINSTISGNSALSSGGGISVRSLGALTMHHCTVAGNSSGADVTSIGGGGISAEGSATLNNTLVAGNTSVITGTDISGTFTGVGVNFIGDPSGDAACRMAALAAKGIEMPSPIRYRSMIRVRSTLT